MFNRGPRQLRDPNRAGPNTRCQKCLKLGHFTYECSSARPYVPRVSHTKQLAQGGDKRSTPSVETPDEFKNAAAVNNSREGLADRILKAKAAERERIRQEDEKKRANEAKAAAKSAKKGRKDVKSKSKRRFEESIEVASENEEEIFLGLEVAVSTSPSVAIANQEEKVHARFEITIPAPSTSFRLASTSNRSTRVCLQVAFSQSFEVTLAKASRRS